jgi:hypothetical protein
MGCPNEEGNLRLDSLVVHFLEVLKSVSMLTQCACMLVCHGTACNGMPSSMHADIAIRCITHNLYRLCILVES